MLYEKLTKKDKELIEQYIEYYGPCSEGYNSPQYARRADLNHVLRHWDFNKQNLYKLLGEEFIIERHVKLDVDTQLIENKLRDMYYSDKILHDRTYAQILRHFHSWIRNVSCCNWEYIRDRFETDNSINYIDDNWFGLECLAKNVFEGSPCIIYLPDSDKPYQIKTGMRLTRLIERIRKAYGEDGANGFSFSESDLAQLIDLIAIARSSSSSEFDISLSIHPMDYMTMSDNDSNWSSCMSWKDHTGDYRLGTVECMNSPTVVVAYVKTKPEMRLGFDNATWANKSWRQLFIVDENAIIAVKGYPFQHDSIVKFVMNWLKELALKNWNINYDISGVICDNCSEILDENKNAYEICLDDIAFTIRLHANWNFMYDDLGTIKEHMVLANSTGLKNFFKVNDDSHNPYYQSVNYEIQASGEASCMWCGDYIDPDDGGYEDECNNVVFCSHCAEYAYTSGCSCEYCGERHVELTYIEDLDSYLCEDCIDEHLVRDSITERAMWDDQCLEVYLALGTDKEGKTVCMKNPISLNKYTSYHPSELARWFKNPETLTAKKMSVKVGWAVSTEDVIFPSDLTEDGLKYFLDNAFPQFDTLEEYYEYLDIVAPYDENFAKNINRKVWEHENETRNTELYDNNINRYWNWRW